jgi:hypothetical protein
MPPAHRSPFGQRLLETLGVVCAFSMLTPAVSLAATQEDHTQFSVRSGSLTLQAAPTVPTLSSIAPNGKARTTNATMTPFIVLNAAGASSGWTLTIGGQSGAGNSAVFAQYCPKAKCGSDSHGYVSAGRTLPADSLTLNSAGASFLGLRGTTGTAPTLQCSTACAMDHGSAVEIAAAAEDTGQGTWLAAGFSASSLALATPTTLRALPNEEMYRVNELWTLNSGPYARLPCSPSHAHGIGGKGRTTEHPRLPLAALRLAAP